MQDRFNFKQNTIKAYFANSNVFTLALSKVEVCYSLDILIYLLSDVLDYNMS